MKDDGSKRLAPPIQYPGKFLCCHHFPITVAVLLVLLSDWNCTKQSGVFALQQAAPAVPH